MCDVGADPVAGGALSPSHSPEPERSKRRSLRNRERQQERSAGENRAARRGIASIEVVEQLGAELDALAVISSNGAVEFLTVRAALTPSWCG